MADMDDSSLDALSARLDEVEGYLHVDELRGTVAQLEQESAAPGFWDDANVARETMARLSAAKSDVAGIDNARASSMTRALRSSLARRLRMMTFSPRPPRLRCRSSTI